MDVAYVLRGEISDDEMVDLVTAHGGRPVLGPCGIPRRRDAEQPALEPAVLDPREVPHDACDRQLRRGQRPHRGLLPGQAGERGARDPAVLVEPLREGAALVLLLKIRLLGSTHLHTLPGSAVTPPA